ncbi:PCMT-domain-containing protein [Durotheca rogersii]|uniref:PCMT-domain-containing protein n=1 Tax=Durotheca rogersii TaxID=419775 RepID=UPI00221F5847|nr:PCMT-domain-containing protein [Durotheca rogersii]KAI5860874.1 PCMT-domain-containing protein [Durotheca rogersii]
MDTESTNSSNEGLVEALWRKKQITHPLVKAAFLKVDRGQYAPENAYEDKPQRLSPRASINSPSMHAKAVETLLPYLLPVEGAEEAVGVRGRPRRILDIGSGSGFLVHVFAELAGETSLVVGVDHVEDLRKLGEANMRKSAEGAALVDSGRVRFRLGDGRRGWHEPSPEDASSPNNDGWDVIHVGAAVVKLHNELVRQLRCPGRLLIPVADEEDNWFSDKYIWTVDKDENGRITKKKHNKVWLVSPMDVPRRSAT